MSATETAASIIESKEGNGAGALRRNATRASGGKPVNVIKVDIHCVTSAYQQDSEKNNFDETCHNFKPGSSEFAARCKEFDNCSVVYRFIKRLFDITFSLCVVVVGLIPCLVLCGAIMLDTKGSPIYTQERVGRYGKPFRIFKFRTMVADSDDVEKYLSPEQLKEWIRERKVHDDPRITSLGKILRGTSLDELPQFINVIRNEMSVVGPRVISYDELANYNQADIFALLSVPQGITGPWQAGPRNEASFDNGQRQIIELW